MKNTVAASSRPTIGDLEDLEPRATIGDLEAGRTIGELESTYPPDSAAGNDRDPEGAAR